MSTIAQYCHLNASPSDLTCDINGECFWIDIQISFVKTVDTDPATNMRDVRYHYEGYSIIDATSENIRLNLIKIQENSQYFSAFSKVCLDWLNGRDFQTYIEDQIE